MVSRMPSAHDRAPHPEVPVLAGRWAGPTDPATPTLVLLHGLGDSGDCWPDAVRRWSRTYRVIGVDALGHGHSPRFTPGQLAAADPVEEMYAAAEATVAHIVTERGGAVVLVGHSMGGGLAAAMASRRPDLVTAAVLEEPAWRDPQWRVQPADVVAERLADCRAFVEQPLVKLAEARRDNPAWPEAEFEPWARAKTEVDLDFLALGVASLAESWDALVAAITVPTLAVTGDGSVLVDESIRRRAEAIGNPNLRVEVVAGAGHCVRRDRPDAFHAVVDPWLATHA
jgi:lipase